MSKQSENLTHLDAVWQNYVNNDPDLRRLEREKQALERKHSVLAGTRQRAEAERRQRRMELLQLIPAFITGALAFVMVYLLALITSVF